ncbi:hypothetical protein Cadr_000027474 [Camelus dromedarius]|uniref:Uncharacterized protein n=1 Tax=Camelus dromedarius TaxID=9838 RepID=A0A5N4CC32_CAMDR|nr:hypothetical protein Cadr_000027474 [Camelus dromedarius]
MVTPLCGAHAQQMTEEGEKHAKDHSQSRTSLSNCRRVTPTLRCHHEFVTLDASCKRGSKTCDPLGICDDSWTMTLTLTTCAGRFLKTPSVAPLSMWVRRVSQETEALVPRVTVEPDPWPVTLPVQGPPPQDDIFPI